MRQIGTYEDPAQSRKLVQILRGHDIRSQCDKDGVLWVLDDSKLEHAREIAAAFRQDPSSVAFAAARKQGEALEADERARDKHWQARLREARRFSAPATLRPLFTWLVAALCVIATVATDFGHLPRVYAPLLLSDLPAGYGLVEVTHGQIWRLVTPAFLHFNLMHLGFNLLAWLLFGASIERALGPKVFLALFLWTDVAGFLLQWAMGWWFAPAQVVVAGGLSGVVYGLVGFALIHAWLEPDHRLGMGSLDIQWMLLWLVLGFTGFVGSIANGAHVGGLLAGVGFALVGILWRRYRKWRRTSL